MLRSWSAALLVGAIFCVAACSADEDPAAAVAAELALAKDACATAAEFEARACRKNCSRLPEDQAATCETRCESTQTAAADRCAKVTEPGALRCAPASNCAFDTAACRAEAEEAFAACDSGCGDEPLALRCRLACDEGRAAAESACGFVVVRVEAGIAETPSLPTGRPADLSVLLDAEELAVVEAADARAAEIRTRPLRVYLGRPGVEVSITQVAHAFEFGFPIDFREFVDAPEELEFYRGIAKDHASMMVAETGLKWRTLEPEPGVFRFDLGDSELAWAEENGFNTKMHTLLWGNAPPFSTGSGTPEWLREQFPEPELTEAQREELRGLIRTQAETVVRRYAGRFDVYDVTNETLNLLTPWFADRLGPEIVAELFGWVRAIDPGAQLVMNEWIVEVFTGLSTPTAAEVRDRVLELREAGVAIDAVGQQAHFAPTIVFASGADLEQADLSIRTRIDDYASALDTLAETGLPIHMTEVTFNTPADPEARAAQAEAIMRVWWGHKSVEQIVFWSLWNRIAARSQLQHGVFDDTMNGTLTRHGEAIVSLMNDRWRTEEIATTGGDGAVELQATLGTYVAQWEVDGQPHHVRFEMDRGPGGYNVVALPAANEVP